MLFCQRSIERDFRPLHRPTERVRRTLTATSGGRRKPRVGVSSDPRTSIFFSTFFRSLVRSSVLCLRSVALPASFPSCPACPWETLERAPAAKPNEGWLQRASDRRGVETSPTAPPFPLRTLLSFSYFHCRSDSWRSRLISVDIFSDHSLASGGPDRKSVFSSPSTSSAASSRLGKNRKNYSRRWARCSERAVQWWRAWPLPHES